MIILTDEIKHKLAFVFLVTFISQMIMRITYKKMQYITDRNLVSFVREIYLRCTENIYKKSAATKFEIHDLLDICETVKTI